MTADTTVTTTATDPNDTTIETTVVAPIVTNRLFLADIDYKNYDFEGDVVDGDGDNNDLSPETVKERLEELFSKFGSVQEIFLSDKEDVSRNIGSNDSGDDDNNKGKSRRAPFGFIAMETSEQAQTALRELAQQQQQEETKEEQSTGRSSRLLFKDVSPANSHKSKNNKQNRNERARSERLKEYRMRASAFVKTYGTTTTTSSIDGGSDAKSESNAGAANVILQVHTSHLERLRDFVLTLDNVSMVGSFSAQKGTFMLLLRVVDDDKAVEVGDTTTATATEDDGDGDYLERFSRKLWNTWFVAPNLNRVTLLNTNNNKEDGDEDEHLVNGDIRTGVVPAIFRSLSKIHPAKNDATTTVSLRVAVFPPKLQRALLEGIEDYNNNKDNNMDIQLDPGNPTHTISIIQLHPGVVVSSKSKNITNDNDKALYVLGRLETVPNAFVATTTRKKRSLSEDSSGDNNYKFQFQQQQQQQRTTSVVPQQQKHKDKNNDNKNMSSGGAATSAHNSNLKVISNNEDGSVTNDDSSKSSPSICRAYWKLQEAWERYQYEPPSLYGSSDKHNDNNKELMWALDCGAAPGGWTKFLFRPGVVGRIYAVDPGKLSPEVVPGLEGKDYSASGGDDGCVIRHLDTTIQKAMPQLATELKIAADAAAAAVVDSNNNRNNNNNNKHNKHLDIWVSDMCVKDMSGQIDCFLQARTEGVVGSGTFFVLTLKCIVGYSSTAFDQQTAEQVKRLKGISRDVDVIHLFSNRSSERTVIGYLI